jgi:hypothetical protein
MALSVNLPQDGANNPYLGLWDTANGRWALWQGRNGATNGPGSAATAALATMPLDAAGNPLNVDGSGNLKTAIWAGGGAVNGTQASTDGQGATAQGLITLGYLFGFNGTSWDRLRVDANKTLKTAPTDTAGNALTFINNRVPSSLGSVAVGAGVGFPAALTASADTLYRFASTAHRFVLQNNTSVAVYVEFGTPASPGSLCLPPASGGIGSYLEFWWEGTDVHLYSTLASSVDGATAGGIVLKAFQ